MSSSKALDRAETTPGPEVAAAAPKSLSERPAAGFTGGPPPWKKDPPLEEASDGSAGLLLSSLQRIYCEKSAPGPSNERAASATRQRADGPAPASTLPAGRPASFSIADASASPSLSDLLDVGCGDSEFDPLPFVDRREDELEQGRLDRPGTAAPGRTSEFNRPGETISPRALRKPDLKAQAASAPAGAADRRKLPRRDSDCTVTICLSKGDERPTCEKSSWMLHSAKIKGQVFDVSMSGVAMHLADAVAPQAKLLLRISNRNLDKHVDATATVLRCREADDGGWSVVCRFDKNLTFDQIHLIGRNLFAATIV